MWRLLRFIPVTRAAAALWAWRNRRELSRWLGFAWRAFPPFTGDRNDLIAEAKLRAALSRDERTRGVPTLAVRVSDGIAYLDGRLPPPLHDLVYSIAASTTGLGPIECRIAERGYRGPPRPHVHATHVPARVDR